MFDQWETTIPKSTEEMDPVKVVCKISPGTLTYIGIFFPPGCYGLAKCRVKIGEKQVFPRSPGNFIAGSGFMVEAKELNEKITGNIPTLTWLTWNEDNTYPHTLWLFAQWISEEEAYAKQTANVITDFVNIMKRLIGL